MTSSQTTPRCRIARQRRTREEEAYSQLRGDRSSLSEARWGGKEEREKGLEGYATHLRIVHIMNLIEDHKLDISNQIRSLVEHASKDFGRHLLEERRNTRTKKSASRTVELSTRSSPLRPSLLPLPHG